MNDWSKHKETVRRMNLSFTLDNVKDKFKLCNLYALSPERYNQRIQLKGSNFNFRPFFSAVNVFFIIITALL